MSTEGSAYAKLGLQPGADADAIDRAYKTLIKRYHPDRAGGDARRAAEINRAYRDLRDLRGIRDGLLFHDDDARPARARPWLVIAALMGLMLLAVAATSLSRLAGDLPIRPAIESTPRAQAAAADGEGSFLDGPLDQDALADGIRQARQIAASGDEMALTRASRDCHAELRLAPSLAQLDRCAAFDDAVVLMQDRDPLRDEGPFSELAVTGRQMSSATLLSGDYLEIDARLDRIRLKVELALAPVQPDLPPIENLAEPAVGEP